MIESKKITELLNDEGFINNLENIKSMEDFSAAFAQYGVEITVEEAENLAKNLVAIAKDGELNVEQLDDVAGGGFVQDLWKWGTKGWNYGKKFCDYMYKTFGIV